MASHPLSYSAQLVRAHDRDRYLCALFAPPDLREAWFALFAFNHEIASIPEMVSEDMIGFMRFAWWREAVDEIYSGLPVRRHPVAQALERAVKEHHLPRAPLDRMLEGREKRFAEKAMQERPQWEEYFRATSSSLLALCAQAADAAPSPATDALGIAWGSMGMARVFAMAGDHESAAELRKAGLEWLEETKKGLPEWLVPFHATARFYLRRLTRHPEKAQSSSCLLPLTLCWKSIIGNIKNN